MYLIVLRNGFFVLAVSITSMFTVKVPIVN